MWTRSLGSGYMVLGGMNEWVVLQLRVGAEGAGYRGTGRPGAGAVGVGGERASRGCAESDEQLAGIASVTQDLANADGHEGDNQ